jgi:hypothetical protein
VKIRVLQVAIVTAHPLLLRCRCGLLRLLFCSVIIGILALVVFGTVVFSVTKSVVFSYEECRHSGLYGVIGIYSKEARTTI